MARSNMSRYCRQRDYQENNRRAHLLLAVSVLHIQPLIVEHQRGGFSAHALLLERLRVYGPLKLLDLQRQIVDLAQHRLFLRTKPL